MLSFLSVQMVTAIKLTIYIYIYIYIYSELITKQTIRDIFISSENKLFSLE